MFDEIPKVEFTVTENGKTVYRDAITFSSMAELRGTSTVEREAMFQERYEAWQANVAQMAAEANEAEIVEGS